MSSKNVLVITSGVGIERDELVKPLQTLRDKGVNVTHASIGGGEVGTMSGDVNPDKPVKSETKISSVSPDQFDALVIPGGTANADTLRQDKDAQRIVKSFADANKVVAAICHGPWVLIDSGVVVGKTLTSYQSCKIDLLNAGAKEWVDEEVKEDKEGGWLLITSRNPNDVPAFNKAILKAIGVS